MLSYALITNSGIIRYEYVDIYIPSRSHILKMNATLLYPSLVWPLSFPLSCHQPTTTPANFLPQASESYQKGYRIYVCSIRLKTQQRPLQTRPFLLSPATLLPPFFEQILLSNSTLRLPASFRSNSFYIRTLKAPELALTLQHRQ